VRSSAPTTSGDVSGTWQGYAGVGARSTSVTLSLRQEGPGLSGNLAVSGRPDLSGSVTGRVEGDTLRLRLGSGAVGPELRVQGDTMTGMVSGEPLSVRRVRSRSPPAGADVESSTRPTGCARAVARYRTPIRELYLCGTAAHPGGGVMGPPASTQP
jgi:hypothetical protein